MLGSRRGLGVNDLQFDLLDLRVRRQHPLEDAHRDGITEVTLAQQACFSWIGEITRFDGGGRDVRTHPELRLGRHTVVRNLVPLERLSQASVDRLGERQTVGLGIKDGCPVDGRVTVEGVDVQADEQAGAGSVDAVPAFGNLDVLITGPGQDHLDTLFCE